jgi:hypothetical protein
MRPQIVGLLVAIGALLAACGGGGKAMLPLIAQPSASAATTPGQQATRRMAIVFNVPPASKQSKARKPFYVSPNTQSIAIAVIPNGSGTPTPSELQVFPVTTPSPCATTGAGGETCTFNVSAPYGTDIFYVATFAVASPNPASTTVPLASFVSGAIVISSPGPGPTPTPLTFTLNGIVNSVVLTVPNPDPSNTPNTQVFVAASPTAVPLGITPYDSSGAPILSDTFLAPIPIIVTPQGEGVGLTLTSSSPCPTSVGNTTPSSVVDVGCAADLANVMISYPGTITADANDHIVDTFSIAASQMASPAPSPANVVLASNVQTSALASSASGYNAGYLQTLPNNVIAYMLMSTSLTTAQYGTFDASTGTSSAPITLNGTTPSGFFTMSDGSIWVSDEVNDELLCFTAGSGTATNTVNLSGFMTYASNVTFDGTKIWASGTGPAPSPTPSPDIVAYAPLTGTCTTGALASTALGGDIYGDSGLLMAPQTAGGILIDGLDDGGAWTVTPSGVATQLNPGFTPGSGFGGGVSIDGTGVGYFLFNNTTTSYIMNLASGGNSLSQLVNVPSGNIYAGLAAFGPNGGAADRIGYGDRSNAMLGVVEGPNSATPINILTTLGNANFTAIGQAVAISTKGAGFVVYLDLTSNAVTLARTEFTTTWWIPVTTLPQRNILSIDERGDSGPFTLTPVGTPPSCLGTISTVPGTDHDFYVPDLSGSSTCVVTLKVTDKNGRSQTVTVTGQPNAG